MVSTAAGVGDASSLLASAALAAQDAQPRQLEKLSELLQLLLAQNGQQQASSVQ
jgi:hypothetical protein